MPDRRPAGQPSEAAAPRPETPRPETPRPETLPPPGPVQGLMRRHAVAVDVLVATAYLVVGGFGTASAWLATGVGRPPAVDATLTLALVVTAGALLVRRRRPVATFVMVLASTVASAVVSPGVDPVGLSLALYALAVHRTSRAGWIGFATAVVVGAVVVPLSAVLRADPGEGAGVPVISPIPVLVLLVAVLVGVTVCGRRRHVAALVDRAEKLERERDQRERLATAAERARITREMHDIVAHGISVMVSLADGAEALVEKEPARSRAALGDIGDVGRRSLTDMRRLLGTLGRDDEASDVGLGPAPSVADLPALVETCRAAGLPVVLETSGVAPRSEGVQTVVYRIVQEALTNALRYAESPQEARVTIAYGPPVTVVVADDGRGPVDGRAPLGEGRGLVGMRERARLYGGSVEAGPGPGGGWRVAVDLPDVEEGR